LKNAEGCPGGEFVLVADSNDQVVFFQRMYVPTHVVDLENTKYNVKEADKADVVILQQYHAACTCTYSRHHQRLSILAGRMQF